MNGSPTPSLLLKLLSIMEAIPGIEKDKKNEFHNYDYASEKIIKQVLHKELVKHGVLLSISITEAIQQGPLLLIKMSYAFIDVATGEKLEGTFMGSGEDKGDKALYKAITGGIKYLLTTQFLIPTGDDPEAISKQKNRIAQEKEGTLTKVNATQLETVLKQWEEFCVKSKIIPADRYKKLIATISKEYGVSTLEELSSTNYEALLARLSKHLA